MEATARQGVVETSVIVLANVVELGSGLVQRHDQQDVALAEGWDVARVAGVFARAVNAVLEGLPSGAMAALDAEAQRWV